MKDLINRWIDKISDFLAYRKGMLPFVGIVLIIANWLLQLVPEVGWLATSHTFLHLGIIVAIIGFMIAWAL